MKSNPILKTLKENDIVMIEIPSMERADIKEICRIFNLKYLPPNEKYNFDWLHFEVEILYTNMKLHKSMLTESVGNCMAITEVIAEEQVQQIARINDMWKATDYLMSDAELEYKRSMALSKINY